MSQDVLRKGGIVVDHDYSHTRTVPRARPACDNGVWVKANVRAQTRPNQRRLRKRSVGARLSVSVVGLFGSVLCTHVVFRLASGSLA